MIQINIPTCVTPIPPCTAYFRLFTVANMGPARSRGGSGGHGPATLDSKMWPSVERHCKREQLGAGTGIGVEVVSKTEFEYRSRGKDKGTAETMGEVATCRNRNAMRLLQEVLGNLADRDNIKVFIHLYSVFPPKMPYKSQKIMHKS